MARFETQSPNLKADFAGSVSVDAANGVPTLATDGLALPSQGDTLIVNVWVDGGGGDGAEFRVWLYRQDLGAPQGWVLWLDPGVAGVTTVHAGTGVHIQEVRGYLIFADRVYVEVMNVQGAPTAVVASVFTHTARGV